MLLHENATNLSITLPEESGDIVLGATIDGQRWHVISGQERARTTVADAGLTDGEAVAWKLDGEKNFIVNVPVEEEDGEGMEE
jgi:hypothetical protein